MISMIEIHGKEHPMLYGYGALMLAEEILGKPWGEVLNMRANFVLWWCCLLNADADFPYSFDEFVGLCDEDHSLVQQMGAALGEQLGRWGKPSVQDEADKKKG